jgi:bacteriocin-like protein
MDKFKELSFEEMQGIDGGNRYKKAWELIEKGIHWLGIADAAMEFKEGFQEAYSSNVEECC